MKTIANTFFKGLLFALPVAATFGLLYWLFAMAENLLKVPLEFVLPAGWYVPGMGVIAAVGLIFVLGILVQAYLVKHVFIFFEKLLESIPIVKSIYSSARDLLQFVTGSKGKDLQKVVAVQISDDVRLVGFVTNENATLGGNSDVIAVYLPMSYQVGGYLVYVPKEKCETLDMPVKDAMQMVLTADIGNEKKKNRSKDSKQNNDKK